MTKSREGLTLCFITQRNFQRQCGRVGGLSISLIEYRYDTHLENLLTGIDLVSNTDNNGGSAGMRYR